MLIEQRKFRRSLFLDALSLQLVMNAFLFHYNRTGSFNVVDLFYILGLFIFFRPFELLKERIEIRDDHVVRTVRGKVKELIPLADIVAVEGRSLLGLIPFLTIKSHDHTMAISLNTPGALELTEPLRTSIDKNQVLREFFEYYSELFKEHKIQWNIMAEAGRWYLIFGLIAPVFVWDRSAQGTLYWMLVSLFYIILVHLVLKAVHHMILSISLNWGKRHLPQIRTWFLFLSFLFYLLQGVRFNGNLFF